MEGIILAIHFHLYCKIKASSPSIFFSVPQYTRLLQKLKPQKWSLWGEKQEAAIALSASLFLKRNHVLLQYIDFVK